MNKNKLVLALLLTISLAFVLSGLAQQKADDTATDPVCGMTVKKLEAKATFDYRGTTYYFCSAGCKEAFAKEPEKYLQTKEAAAPGKPSTCPGCGKEMAAQRMSHGRMMGHRQMMKMEHRHGQMSGPAGGMNCPLQSEEIEMKTENLPDGVAVKITSKNPELVKKIQEHIDKQKGNCAGCCCRADQAQEKK